MGVGIIHGMFYYTATYTYLLDVLVDDVSDGSYLDADDVKECRVSER